VRALDGVLHFPRLSFAPGLLLPAGSLSFSRSAAGSPYAAAFSPRRSQKRVITEPVPSFFHLQIECSSSFAATPAPTLRFPPRRTRLVSIILALCPPVCGRRLRVPSAPNTFLCLFGAFLPFLGHTLPNLCRRGPTRPPPSLPMSRLQHNFFPSDSDTNNFSLTPSIMKGFQMDSLVSTPHIYVKSG